MPTSIITETDFEVAQINNSIDARIKIRPMYFELGLSPYSVIYSRRAVKDRLIEALAILPKQYGFLVWDVYRPRFVQEKLFVWMSEEISKKYPHFSKEENHQETCKYISPPSKVGEDYCAPHLSGGAIDLTLFDIDRNETLEMGTPFDDCSIKAHSHYFDKLDNLNPAELQIKQNRDMLRDAMKAVGFLPYQYEWWHFDIGDIFWSRLTGKPAVFGPLFDDNEWPNAENR